MWSRISNFGLWPFSREMLMKCFSQKRVCHLNLCEKCDCRQTPCCLKYQCVPVPENFAKSLHKRWWNLFCWASLVLWVCAVQANVPFSLEMAARLGMAPPTWQARNVATMISQQLNLEEFRLPPTERKIHQVSVASCITTAEQTEKCKTWKKKWNPFSV